MSEKSAKLRRDRFRASALEAILEEHGQDIRRYVTAAELEEMIEERILLLARHAREAA